MIARSVIKARAEASDFSNKMIYLKQLTAVCLAGLMILPPAPLLARTRKGDKLLEAGRLEEQKGNLESALVLTAQAVADDPGDAAYILQLHRVRFALGTVLVKNGQKMREAGNLTDALAAFEKAYATDPASDIAAQEIRRTREMIDRAKNADGSGNGPRSKVDTTGMTPSELAKKEAQDRTDSLMPLARLKPLNTDVIDHLKMMDRPRTLFLTVAGLAGINVVFDPDYNTQQTIQQAQIDLSRTTLEAALEQVALVTKSFWKPYNSNTIFVSVDNRNNRTQYTEQVVKVYYLSNTTSAQQIQEVLTVLRTVVDVQKVFNYTAQNALVVRADADAIALVDKLISDLDKPLSEVIVDILVLGVNSSYVRNLTMAFAPTGINSSAVFAPRPGITTPGLPASTTGGATTSVPISQLGHLSSADYSITNLPGAQLEAMLTDSNTRILQAPQVRASNNTKAVVKIGDKIPIATGSFQSGVGAVGAFPSANTQFSFQDVGVNVEITPWVHDNDEVSLHVDLDVSQVKDRIDIGGISQPEITQNKVTADIRLREGEANLIGGIVKESDSKAITGIPGLAHIPILGRFFSGEDLEKDKQELVIVLVPHIVRGPDITASNLKGVSAGSSGQIKVSYDQTRLAASAPAAASGNGPAAAVTPPATAPSSLNVAPPAAGLPVTASPVPAPAGGSLPATAPPATAPPAGVVPFGVPGMVIPTAPPATAPAPGGAARISFQPATTAAQLSSTVTLTLYAENVANLADVAAQLRYDPKILRVANIVAGDLPQRDLSAPAEPVKNVADDAGRADMRVSRGATGGTISGSGGLFSVVFQAIGRGNTAVTVGSLAINGPAGASAANTPAPATVSVQ
jgi:general secretion pathway protein D